MGHCESPSKTHKDSLVGVDMFQLRPYQESLIEDSNFEFQNHKKRVCIVSPCGSGKTMIMAHMSIQARLQGSNVLFVVHRQELIEQSSKTFSEFYISHGIIAAGYMMDVSEKIQIASIQTVVRRLEKINVPDIIILDECQHSPAGTWRKLLDYFPNAFVIGLTATPWRMGGRGLGDIFESLIMGPSIKELIEMGNLAPFQYYAPPVAADLDGIKVKYGEFDKADVTLRMDKSEIIGDLISYYNKLIPGASAVCYCSSISHSEHTAEMFRQANISAVHIDGETPMVVRKDAIDGFRNGNVKILCNVDLVSEGLDIPTMDAVILARPTQSLTLFIQQAMRCMRMDKNNPGKIATIIDHVGNVYRHGLPDEDRAWSLEGKVKKREPNEISIRQCPECYYAHLPAKQCPKCGFVYAVNTPKPLEQTKGELLQIKALERAELNKEVGRARTREALELIAIKRGYSLRWVDKRLAIRGQRG